MRSPISSRRTKVLVLDSDCAAAIECIQSLGRAGAVVHASAIENCLAFSSVYCAHSAIQPRTTLELARWIGERHAQERYDLIVPASEVALIALLSDAVDEDIYEKAFLSPRESVRCALDKEHTRKLAEALHIPVPHSVLISAADAPPETFPVILKPVHSKSDGADGVSDHRVCIVNSRDEWQSAMRTRYHGMSVQQQTLVSGKGIGVEMLFEHGELRWSFIHERLHELPLTGGGSSYRRAYPPVPRLLAHAETLLKSLCWHGVAMVEFKLDGDVPYLMEINPRFWGSLALAIDAGVDFPRALLRLASAEPLGPQPQYKIGYRTRNLVRDVEWMKANLRADHSNPQLHTRPKLRAIVEYLLPLTGRESWDYFDLRDLGVTARVIVQIAKQHVSRIATMIRARIALALYRNVTHPRLLRKLQRAQPNNLLFVCYGNICRSPLAEAVARQLMPDATISSAGFFQKPNRCSPPFMRAAAQDLGFDLSAHRSQVMTQQIVDDADAIFIMDRRNYELMRQHFPRAMNKTLFLGLFAQPPMLQIADPFDAPQNRAVAISKEIISAVHGLAQHLQKHTAANARGAGS